MGEDAWRLRIAYTQEQIFHTIKVLSGRSEDDNLKKLTARQWFSAFDMTLTRLLPDGNVVAGAPYSRDLELRSEIVAEILDGLKTRPREGAPEPRALFNLNLYEYDLLLALSQVYQKAGQMLKSAEVDVYEASSLETTVLAMMHVVRLNGGANEVNARPFTEEDYENCSL